MNLDSFVEEENVIGDWNKEKILGTGGFGTVALWRHQKTKDTIALKQCRWGHDAMMTPKHRQRWKLEIDIMKRLNHQNVVKTIEVPAMLDVPNTEIPLMAMEYCCGGDLRKILSKPENCCGIHEKEIRVILRHVISAVEYLHSMRIIHRDLKPENIVIQEIDGKYVYKLIDLGYAKELDQGSLCTSFVGTLQYLAPELFLSHTYSSTVDFWSLGLLAHEVITGQRPFFPNLSPAQWIPLVKQKMTEDICGYLNEQNKAVFSKEICSYCAISKIFKNDVQEWLQLMLEFDPKLRGRKNGAVVTFQVLRNLLEKKVLRIFYADTCTVLEYEINGGSAVKLLKEWLQRETGVSVDSQEVLLMRGQPIDPTVDLLQLWANPEEDDSMLFLFNTSPALELPDVSPRIPVLVERMMRNPRHPVSYETQRAYWMEAVFLSQQQARLYQKLLQAYKVSLMNLLMKNSSMHKHVVTMQKMITRLTSKCDFFKTVLEQDIQKVEEYMDGNKYSSAAAMCTEWKKTLVKLEQIKKLQKTAADCELVCSNGNTKMIDLQQSPYARSKGHNAIEENYQSILAMFAELKRKPKEHRSIKCDNTGMVKLLCTCLKLREKVFNDIFTLLRKSNEVKKDMSAIYPELIIVMDNIASFDAQLTQWQNERQGNIWKLVSNLVDRVNVLETAPPNYHTSGDWRQLKNGKDSISSQQDCEGDTNFLRYGHSSHPDDSFQSLSLILKQYTVDSQKVRKENQELMSDMMSILSLQQKSLTQDDDMDIPMLMLPNQSAK